MNYLEVTIRTAAGTNQQVASLLTAGGFSDLVMEDQNEFEEFLDENRNYWDYIDESLQQQLQKQQTLQDTNFFQKLMALKLSKLK